MTLRRIVVRWGLVLITGVSAALRAEEPIPPHPSQIKFPDFKYKVPSPSQFRTTLANGMVVYIAEDRMLPTFDLSVALRTGSAVEPADKAGLAALTGEQMRDGGTRNLTPEELDERVEFLAANLTCNIGETRGRAALSCLSKDIDAGLELCMEMLRYPRFDEQRFRLAVERQLQNVKRRNDSTASIANAEWGFLIHGDNHFSNRYPSSATLKSIPRDDLIGFHRRYVHPGNMILAVAGDFDRAEVLKKLEKAFGDWPAGETGPTSFPKPDHQPVPGVYLVQKEGVNQGRVSIGHSSVMRGGPDEFPLIVMNGVLGAAGFRSRIVARVRSDEGLAYNSGSRFEQGIYYPGDFQCWFQSKSNSCAYAAKLVIEEINRIQKEKVTQADVDDAVNFYAETFPQRFQTKMALLETYVSDEYTGRDPKYWETYIDNLKRVTPEDVHRVAQKHLRPDKLVILAVGDADAVAAGGYDKAPDARFETFGKVTRLPLRDPDTMKR